MAQQKERIRAFLAVELSDALKDEASQVVRQLEAANPHFRFIPTANWHFTLHFFGSLFPEELEQVKKGLKDAVCKTEPFSIRLKGLGVFPAARRLRVLWIGVEEDRTSLSRIKGEIDAVILKAGLPVEERKFHPHVTIARAREERNQKEIAFGSVSFAGGVGQVVDHLTLLRSELLPGGAKYTVLENIPLKS